jgi:hypothetical protein
LLNTEIRPILTAILDRIQDLEGGYRWKCPRWSAAIGEWVLSLSYDALFDPVLVVR